MLEEWTISKQNVFVSLLLSADYLYKGLHSPTLRHTCIEFGKTLESCKTKSYKFL